MRTLRTAAAALFVLAGIGCGQPVLGQMTVASTATQYVADWASSPGFRLYGTIWDPHASRKVAFDALPPSLVALVAGSNTPDSYRLYRQHFQGVLRRWAQSQFDSGVQGGALVTNLVTLLEHVYADVQPEIAQIYPGYPTDVYKALVVQNLVHGYHTYAQSLYYEAITNQVPSIAAPNLLTTGNLTMADELASLLQAPVADCGEIAETVRVIGRLWGLDTRYLGVYVDYQSPLANAEVASTHALGILVYRAPSGNNAALFTDALTNIAIDAGPVASILPDEMVNDDGILDSAPWAGNRYENLLNANRVLHFFNYFMHPPVRAGYLKASQADASVFALMYAYYLEAYPNALHTFRSSTGWRVNNATYTLNQPRT